MSKSTRLIDIWMYINRKSAFTAQELADEFGVSVRTIQRYLNELSSMGVPLYTEQGRYGGYRMLNNRALPPIVFTEEEAISIFFAHQALHRYESLPFDAEAKSVSEKLYQQLSQEAKKKVDQLRLHLAFWSPTRTISSSSLVPLLEASMNRSIVAMKYESKDALKEKRVTPIGVYAQNGFWYCPAYDHDKRKILLYRVDRAHSAVVLERDDEPRINLAAWLKQEYEEQKNHARVELYIQLDREGVRQCKGHFNLSSALVVDEKGEGTVRMHINREYLPDYASLFYTWGEHVRVVAPQDIQDMLLERAEKQLIAYRAMYQHHGEHQD
ncbi:helix-turn-helix transcriptional regulator [Paenibacillus aquistagni]|uniref:Transcriptional regulator, DeoR family n=1 Tax=Paenibacillus aquistagni TaxID=1852522 RepID=A0A1X7LVJ8_9BACL|nr:YafY family protein [Paenibacillus aquistagni]SMG57487.1 transcriptional regulator, DeoR family [Paenibacillus aquistagni]